MKKWLILIFLVILTNCGSEKGVLYFNNQKAAWYFKSIEEICNKDNGKIWGKNLYGPLMFVDRKSRKIYANMPDNEGLLKLKDGIYTGLYPTEIIIGNTNRNFGGVWFAIILIPSVEDEYRIKTRAITELFKYFQTTRGIYSEMVNTRYMNQKNARFWLKLEWKALRNAISNSGEERIQSLRDALIFRGARRELYKESENLENRIEISEGLPNFTSVRLCTETDEDYANRIIQQIDMVYGFPSYSYSFGTLNGGLYSYFLYLKGFDFLTIKEQNTDLGNIVREVYQIELPAILRDVAGSIALNYDIDGIYREEDARETGIRQRIREQIGTFTEKPVVYIDLFSPYFGFEPENVNPLDTLGTLYSTLRVSDNWGKLIVEKGGTLVSNNLKSIRITAKNIKESKTETTGEGWVLLLNPQWKLEKIEQDYYIRWTGP
jgi:hypothetical protein